MNDKEVSTISLVAHENSNNRLYKVIRYIKTIQEYNNFMDSKKLSNEQRQIADMVFVNGYDYRYIGDKLGYSELTIKSKVSKILEKI